MEVTHLPPFPQFRQCSTYVSTVLCSTYISTVLDLCFDIARPMFRLCCARRMFRHCSTYVSTVLCSTYVSKVLDLCSGFLDGNEVFYDCARIMFRPRSTYVSTVLDQWFDPLHQNLIVFNFLDFFALQFVCSTPH